MAVPDSPSETQCPSPPTKSPPKLEVEMAKCDSCSFTEDCTPAYILKIREKFHGRWICGLCIEAVKAEVLRSEKMISTQEALERHIEVCREFRLAKPKVDDKVDDEVDHPISVIGRLMRRSLDSPRHIGLKETRAARNEMAKPSGAALARSDSCFPSISG